MSILYKDSKVLIKHLEKGVEAAYVYLINTYNKPLLAYVLTLTRDYTIAEDIVQDVFLKIWRKRKELNSIQNFNSYLYRVTYNQFISQYRKTKTISDVEKSYVDILNQVVNDSNYNTEIIQKKIKLLNNEIDLLPERCKEVFLLSKKEGLTNKEIANYLKISIKTVEGQLSKAYRVLRKKLSPKLNEVLFLMFYNIKKHLNFLY